MTTLYSIKYSHHIKARHQKKCGCYLGFVAFIVLSLSIVSFAMFFVTSFSETRTSFIILACISFLGFLVILGFTIHQCINGNEKRMVERNYNANLTYMQKHILEQRIHSSSQLNF